MKTLDLKKQFKNLYQPSAKKVEIVQVPRLQFAMIDGAIEKGYGPGDSPGFQQAVQALYSISYTLKFMLKKRKTDPIDYPVMALEGLLWLTEGEVFDINIKDNWSYTLVIMQPDVITQEVFEEGQAQVRKKRGDSEALSKLRLEYFVEGLCAQIMHIGPYATEPATMERMREFLKENGYRDCVGLGGKHHEIYLGDPRKADPAKLKTVLRHPIEKI
jgi:hypothetical protein